MLLEYTTGRRGEKVMVELDYILVFVMGFSTGLGTTFGSELAKALIEQVKNKAH